MQAKFVVIYSNNFEKNLEKIDQNYVPKILGFIKALELELVPVGWDIKKLKGRVNEYRCRIGVYRILYRLENDKVFIYILDVLHRKDAY